MSLKADYVTLFDEAAGTIDVQGWVTLTNTTGPTFENADTLLIARRVRQEQGPSYRRGYRPPPPPAPPAKPPGTEPSGRHSHRHYDPSSLHETPEEEPRCGTAWVHQWTDRYE